MLPLASFTPMMLSILLFAAVNAHAQKTDAEGRQLIEAGIHNPSKITKPFVLPPGTPNERGEILRKALQETLKDKEFLAETEKAKLGLNPVTGEDLKRTIEGVFKLDSALMAKLKSILF